MPDIFPEPVLNVRKRVLWPIGVTLVVFLLLFIAVFQIHLQRELAHALDQHIDFVATLYRDQLAERSATMESLIKQVQKDPALAQAMLQQDSSTLLSLAQPLFEELLHDQNITHFYFHAADGTNLLRVHKPDLSGDKIDRITMQKARTSKKVASGAELGPLGTFTLRVVLPWFYQDRIIGYVELGEEAEPLLKQVAAQTGSQIALLINKDLLDKRLWQEGQTMLGRPLDWQALPDHVVTATTTDQLAEDAPQFISQPYLTGQKEIELFHLRQLYRGRYLTLSDAGGRNVGEMMILLNIDKTLKDQRHDIALVAIFCTLLGGVLFGTAYSILGRTEQTLKRARQKLIDQIENTSQINLQLELKVEEKQRAEDALIEAHDKLEQRVLERTTQLAQQKMLVEEKLLEVRQSRDRISGIMRSVDDVLFVIDANDRILLMNESACSLLRVIPGEVIGATAASAIGINSLRDKVVETLKGRVGGINFDFEISNTDQGGELVMHAHSSALTDPQGGYEGMIFLARDVTRDRSMDRLKSAFISVAAHELRTPLTTILGFSELLRDDQIQTENDRQEFAQIIHDKAESLSRLLDEMLDISRIESGRGLELYLEPLRVSALFLPTLKQYRMREKDRQFAVDLAEPELQLLADADKIAQVMENLLSNAVKYSENGSAITLTGQVTAEGYQLSISDQGIGMTPEQINHAFDKFYRGDSADRAIKGTGLGLTIAKHIIEEHKGKIWLEAQRDKGTCIQFVLPLA